MKIVHFASKEQIDVLRQLFTAPRQVVFEWPTSDPNERIEESMEWVTPDWIDVMDQFATH